MFLKEMGRFDAKKSAVACTYHDATGLFDPVPGAACVPRHQLMGSRFLASWHIKSLQRRGSSFQLKKKFKWELEQMEIK